jgi:DNA-binding HxlR family transcriptional regulator
MTQIAMSPLAELAAGCDDEAERELVRQFMTRLGDRWTVQVIQQLVGGEVRFTQLMERIPGISHRMLAKTLRTLERDGLVSRTPFPTVPPRVDYRLTPLGESLGEPLLALVGWVKAARPSIEAARADYERG